MPSYRVTMSMGNLRPGVSPASVLPAASAAASEFAIVEAADISVVSGSARLIIRFAESEPEVAAQVGQHIAESTDTVVEVLGFGVTERVRNRWVEL
jgi:hypothetical protein